MGQVPWSNTGRLASSPYFDKYAFDGGVITPAFLCFAESPALLTKLYLSSMQNEKFNTIIIITTKARHFTIIHSDENEEAPHSTGIAIFKGHYKIKPLLPYGIST